MNTCTHTCMHAHTLSLSLSHTQTHTEESGIPRESSDRTCPGQSQAHPPDGNFILRRPWANVEVCSHGASDISRGAGTQTPQLRASEGTTPPRAVKDTTVTNSVLCSFSNYSVFFAFCAHANSMLCSFSTYSVFFAFCAYANSVLC